MATQSQKQSGPQTSTVLLVAAIVALLAFAVLVGRHYLVGSSPSLAQEMDLDKHPIPAWVTQDAKQCEGDITKLGPQEQQKLQTAYPGQSARLIITAAYSVQR